MTGDTTIWKLHPSIRFRRLLDEAVLINQRTAETLVLNDTATSFIERCDGKRTVGEIIAGMAEDFEVIPGKLAEDLAPFIETLSEAGIIEAIANPGASG